MACDKYGRLISLELDGRISPEDEADLMQHVDGCGRCAEERALQRRVSSVLRHGRSEALPSGVAERVAERVLRSGTPVLPVRMPLLRIAAGLVMAFLLGGIAGWWVDRSSAEARAAAHPVAADLASEADAWRALGADDALVARIIDLRRRALDGTGTDAARQLHTQAESTAAILRLLPVAVADAWCRSVGIDRATFESLCKAGGR